MKRKAREISKKEINYLNNVILQNIGFKSSEDLKSEHEFLKFL